MSRVISVVPTAYVLGDGLYAGMVTALNLAQISEFSLVILTLGVGLRPRLGAGERGGAHRHDPDLAARRRT